MVNNEALCRHERIARNCYTCHLEYNYPQEKSELDTLYESISELKVRISKLEEYKRLQDDISLENNNYIKALYEFYYKLDDNRKKQIDENRAVSKHFDDLDADIKVLKDGPYERDDKIMREVEESSKKWNVFFLDSFNERITKLENSPFGKSPTYEPLFKRLHELEVEIGNLKSEHASKHLVAHHYLTITDRLDKLENKITTSFDPGILDTTIVRCTGTGEIPKETLCMDKFTTHKTNELTFEEAFKEFMNGKTLSRSRVRYYMTERNSPTFSPDDILATDWEILS